MNILFLVFRVPFSFNLMGHEKEKGGKIQAFYGFSKRLGI